jgi:biopolymer transport protein ExbB
MKTLLFLALALLQTLLATSAHATWNAEWTKRAKITLNTAADGLALTAGADNVPVLVRLHTGNFQFLDAQPNGADLRFIAGDDKTPLKFHIEKFDGVNELAFVWVLVPRVNPGTKADSLWLYYGNPKAPSASEPKSSYEASQSLVYHFAQAETLPQDATANGNHAARMTAKPATAGLIGAGLSFDGKAELALNASPSLRGGATGYTASMWIKPADVASGVLLRHGEGATTLSLQFKGGALVAQAGGLATAASGTVLAGAWQHVALVVKDGLTVYLNGNEVARLAGSITPPTGALLVGSGYTGDLDELQLASAARTPEWLKLAAGGQGPDQKLLATAPAEGGAEESHASYLTILLSAVTLDGWVVIGVLAIMFVVSFWVMISKALLVRQTGRINQRFMAQFGKLMAAVKPGQPVAEREKNERDIAAHFGTSPLYRLYASAVHELHSRFDAYRSAGREMRINESALSAIKATVDARLVRELQGLNSKLVVLTVSIAGGPFLGLLGTVVGVMITFAAIAAAGDVNVNAIAPGIAAALVATVAGLAVAIPCLFGYNFLTSRIGEITADLQAFVDELVTRIAEDHSV